MSYQELITLGRARAEFAVAPVGSCIKARICFCGGKIYFIKMLS